MNRAYSTLEIKSVDEDARTFNGIASTPSTDRMGDVVEPKGASFKLPLPLLWQHDHQDPIGWITRARVTNSGIEVEGNIAKVDEPGELQNRLIKAWQMIKNKLVRGLSIGFSALDVEEIEGTWGLRFKKWEWLELSAVTIPANAEATITAVKSIDKQLRAASGRKSTTGATVQPRRTKMKTLQEQLSELKEARTNSFNRMNEIVEAVKSEGRDWLEEETLEFDELETEIKRLDNDIRQKTVEVMNASSAKSVDSRPTQRAASASRGPQILKRTEKDEDFPGQNFTRKVIAKALARLDDVSPILVAQKRWGKDNPMLVEVIKAGAIGAGDTGDTDWATELVSYDGRYTGDFIEYLKSKTVFDKLPLRPVPANVTIKGQDGAATGYWVGEGAAIGVTDMDFSTVNLSPLKVAALAVVTNELLRQASPSAEMLVRDALVDAAVQRIDSTFLSADEVAAGESPAGLLNGISALTSNGTDAAALRDDIGDLYAPFIAAKNASGLWFVTTPSLAKSIQLLVNALGLQEFPGINQDGGTLMGDPVVTGDNVGDGDLLLLKPSDIYRIDDTGIEVAISREATIEMYDVPTMNSETPTAMTGHPASMFQTESTAIKIVRSINYAKRRACVQWIDSAEYMNSEASS